MKKMIVFTLALLALASIRLQTASAQIASVTFSPDSKTLAYENNDNVVELLDVATQEIFGMFEGHTDSIWSLSFSPDGRHLASGSLDNTVRVWDVATYENIATFVGHEDDVTSVAFSPNGRLLASGAWDGIVKVWDVETQQNIATLGGYGHTIPGVGSWLGGWITPVSFSPDGAVLAYGAVDSSQQINVLQLWDVETQQNIATIEAHTNGIASIDFSPDGKKSYLPLYMKLNYGMQQRTKISPHYIKGM